MDYRKIKKAPIIENQNNITLTAVKQAEISMKTYCVLLDQEKYNIKSVSWLVCLKLFVQDLQTIYVKDAQKVYYHHKIQYLVLDDRQLSDGKRNNSSSFLSRKYKPYFKWRLRCPQWVSHSLVIEQKRNIWKVLKKLSAIWLL